MFYGCNCAVENDASVWIQSEVLQVGAPLAGVSMHSVEHEWSTVVTGEYID